VRNFQILIVSAVKICKEECMQTASGSLDPLPGLCPWTPLENFSLPDSLGYSPLLSLPQWKFLAPPLSRLAFADFLSLTFSLLYTISLIFCLVRAVHVYSACCVSHFEQQCTTYRIVVYPTIHFSDKSTHRKRQIKKEMANILSVIRSLQNSAKINFRQCRKTVRWCC